MTFSYKTNFCSPVTGDLLKQIKKWGIWIIINQVPFKPIGNYLLIEWGGFLMKNYLDRWIGSRKKNYDYDHQTIINNFGL